jgi:cytochrome P450
MSTGEVFTPRNMNRNIGLIRAQAAAMLDEWVPKGRFDFVEFAATYPISVMCRLTGASTDRIMEIRHSLDTQSRIGSRDPALVPHLLAGFHIMWDFCDRLVREREAGAADPGGLLDQLLVAKSEGQLDDTELRYLLMVLFAAGYDTSKNALSLILYYMIDRPDDWRRCAEDLPFCQRVTEEMFRYHSTVSQKRTVVKEFDYEGVRFPVGTFLIFGTSIAGRDPAMFEDADIFDPDRARDNRSLAFGRGVHMCLGQHLARAQIAEGTHLIAQRITNPRLVGPVAWRQFLGIGGLETFPIEFDPAPARS